MCCAERRELTTTSSDSLRMAAISSQSLPELDLNAHDDQEARAEFGHCARSLFRRSSQPASNLPLLNFSALREHVPTGEEICTPRRNVERIGRSLSRVKPYLYIGSKQSVRDASTIQLNNITHIVNFGGHLYHNEHSSVKYLSLSIRDDVGENIEDLWRVRRHLHAGNLKKRDHRGGVPDEHGEHGHGRSAAQGTHQSTHHRAQQRVPQPAERVREPAERRATQRMDREADVRRQRGQGAGGAGRAARARGAPGRRGVHRGEERAEGGCGVAGPPRGGARLEGGGARGAAHGRPRENGVRGARRARAAAPSAAVRQRRRRRRDGAAHPRRRAAEPLNAFNSVSYI
ncbi:Dual specificity protein phosphatase 19 [Gracilaria domingensis]|nr:Dual specificity protein phosphatase 19 [Gracilaria domingensis]